MAWVTPPSFAANDVLLAADLNTVSDDLAYLKTALDSGGSAAVELKVSGSSVTATLGGVYVVTYTVQFASTTTLGDQRHRISISVGGTASCPSVGGGVVTHLCVAGIARVSAGSTISGTSEGAGTVNSQSLKAARIGA